MIRRLWPLILGAFALGLDAYVLAGLLPGMAGDLATTQARVGFGVALFTAAYAVSAPTLAFVAERSSTRTALLSGLGLFTFGNLATMLAPSLTILLVARLLAGIGAGLYSPLAASSASAMIEPQRRGSALAAILAGLSTGTALGVPIGLIVEDHLGWRWTIGLIVGLGLIAIFGVAIHCRRLPVVVPLTWRERVAALGTPFTAKTLTVTLFTGIASLGLYTYIAELAVARGDADSTGIFIWAWGLGGMTGALLIGRMIDRYFSAGRATALLLAVLGIGFALVGWGTSTMAYMGCFLWGLAGWASVAPQQHALVSDAPRRATAAIAWNSSVNYLGGAIGSTTGSVLLSAHLSPPVLVSGAIALVAAALVVHVSKNFARTSSE